MLSLSRFNKSLMLFLSFVFAVGIHQSFSFQLSRSEKEFTRQNRILTDIPRASYKISKDSDSSFWMVNLNLQEETLEFPMLILPYTTNSWVYNGTESSNNIEGVVCDDLSTCLQITIEQSDDNNTDFFNYSLQGTSGFMQAFPTLYTTYFSIDLVNQAPPLNPPLTIIGGLGLGIDQSDSYTDITPPPFLQSFYNLNNYVAGIYLSTDSFDVTSELLVGDYNPAFIESNGYNTTISSVNPSTWSFIITEITDNNGTLYYNGTYYYNDTLLYTANQVIFDPNYNSIGVPAPVYDQFLSSFANIPNIQCDTNVLAFPTCNCTDYSDLPTLQFYYGPNQNITIPPDLYVQFSSVCTLLITCTNQTGVTGTFNMSWVFGFPVMTYYYTVLNWTNQNYQISLYKTPTFVNSTRWYIIIGAISAVVLVVGLVACLTIIKDRKQPLEEPLVSNVEIMEQKPRELDENQEES